MLTAWASISPPHFPSPWFPTLPSPSSWEFSTSVGHSTFSHPPHFPFYVHNFQFLNHRCSCSFPPPPASLPPSSMNAFFLSKPDPYLLIIQPSSTAVPLYSTSLLQHRPASLPPCISLPENPSCQVQTRKALSQQASHALFQAAIVSLSPYPPTLTRRDAAGFRVPARTGALRWVGHVASPSPAQHPEPQLTD